MLFLAYNSVTRLTMYFMYQNFGFKFSKKNKKERKKRNQIRHHQRTEMYHQKDVL